MRITRAQSDLSPELHERTVAVMEAVDRLFRRPFTGELHITVVNGRATELETIRDVEAPLRLNL